MTPDYTTFTTSELEAELRRVKDKGDEAYQLFAHCAASRGARYVRAFCEAGAAARAIREELRRRKLEHGGDTRR